MALIKCPECMKEISDKAEVCIHCGYPISKTNVPNSESNVDLSLTNTTSESQTNLPLSENDRTLEMLKRNKTKSVRNATIASVVFLLILIIMLRALTFDFNDPNEVILTIIFMEIFPALFILANLPDAIKFSKEYNLAKNNYSEYLNVKQKENQYAKWYTETQKLKSQKAMCCPKCGSTAITTGARGVNWTMGLIGASKTVNRCGNCGHTWKPKSK